MVSLNPSRECIISGKFNFLANPACKFSACCCTSTFGFSGKCKSIQHSHIATISSLLFMYNCSNSFIRGMKSGLLCGMSHGCRHIAVFTFNHGKSFDDSLVISIHFLLYSLFAHAFTNVFPQTFSKFSKYFL